MTTAEVGLAERRQSRTEAAGGQGQEDLFAVLLLLLLLLLLLPIPLLVSLVIHILLRLSPIGS